MDPEEHGQTAVVGGARSPHVEKKTILRLAWGAVGAAGGTWYTDGQVELRRIRKKCSCRIAFRVAFANERHSQL